MVADVERLLARAAAVPFPRAALPPELVRPPIEDVRTVLAPFGEVSCRLF